VLVEFYRFLLTKTWHESGLATAAALCGPGVEVPDLSLHSMTRNTACLPAVQVHSQSIFTTPPAQLSSAAEAATEAAAASAKHDVSLTEWMDL
jgi:hypothetical protein